MKRPQGVPLATLKHQDTIISVSQSYWQFMASAETCHARLSRQNEDFHLLPRHVVRGHALLCTHRQQADATGNKCKSQRVLQQTPEQATFHITPANTIVDESTIEDEFPIGFDLAKTRSTRISVSSAITPT